jgi:putative transposase
MKKGRYNEEQVVRILREADRDPVAEVAKRHGVSEQSIYGWRKRYGEFGVDEVRRLKGSRSGEHKAAQAAGGAGS